jgi:protein regulator of cytokinesis 1
MKELVLKKRSELEEICRKTHMVPEVDSTMEYAMEAIESGICLGDCHVTLILHIL